MTSAGSAGWIICEAETRLHQRRRGVAPCPPLCLLLQHIVMCGLPPCRVHPRGGAQEISIHAHRADRLRRVALCPRHRAHRRRAVVSRTWAVAAVRLAVAVGDAAGVTMYWFAGMIEMCGAVLFWSACSRGRWRSSSSGEMAFAYFIGHAPRDSSDPERRRRRDPLLLHVPVFRVRGRGAMEPRRAVAEAHAPRRITLTASAAAAELQLAVEVAVEPIEPRVGRIARHRRRNVGSARLAVADRRRRLVRRGAEAHGAVLVFGLGWARAGLAFGLIRGAIARLGRGGQQQAGSAKAAACSMTRFVNDMIFSCRFECAAPGAFTGKVPNGGNCSGGLGQSAAAMSGKHTLLCTSSARGSRIRLKTKTGGIAARCLSSKKHPVLLTNTPSCCRTCRTSCRCRCAPA